MAKLAPAEPVIKKLGGQYSYHCKTCSEMVHPGERECPGCKRELDWPLDILREFIAKTEGQEFYRDPFSIETIASTQRSWSSKKFGPGKMTERICRHIQKELDEVIGSDGDDIMEWADIILLAIEGAWRAGHRVGDIAYAVAKKQNINHNEREWPDVSEIQNEQPIEHRRK